MVHIIAITTFNVCFLALECSIVDLAFHVNEISRMAARFNKSLEVNQNLFILQQKRVYKAS